MNYYPFGSILSLANRNYRYGFQGKYAEMDKETGWNSFELLMYEHVVGRWLSIDPEAEFSSPYLAMGNNPVNTVDPDGGGTGGPDDPIPGNGGKPLNEVVITAKRLTPIERATARTGISNINFYADGRPDAGVIEMMRGYKDYRVTMEKQPHFEEYYLEGLAWLTGAGELMELGQGIYTVGRFGFKKYLQRGIVVDVSTGTEPKLLTPFSNSTIEEAVDYAMKNKVTHVFEKAAHQLEPLVAYVLNANEK